jgi:basic membrane lipoprotein Med (substrate-binding protein (PBP1-ABC) superfamily)
VTLSLYYYKIVSYLMNQKAISQVQSTSIIAIIVIALVVAGSAYYISTVPTELTTVTETATTTTTTTAGGGTTTVTQTITQTNTATQTVTATPGPIKVAMLFTGSPTVSLWDKAGLEGLELAQDRYGIEFESIEFITAEENERALRSLADRGYDIIFDHDSLMFDTVAKVAPDYPDTWFGTSAPQFGVDYIPNQFTYTASTEEALYLAGIVTGSMTLENGNNKIGFPVPYLYPFMWAAINSFKMGAHSVNPNAEIYTVEMFTWVDPIKGIEAAEALLDLGCETFIQLASGGEVGVVEVLRANNIPAVAGAATDAAGFYELDVGTGIYNYPVAISDIIGIYSRDGGLENIHYVGGVARGWVDFIFEHPELAPIESFQTVFIAKQQIADGTIQVPYVPDETPPDWTFPTIPHELEGRESCSTCHDVNQLPQEAPAHGWLTDGNCLTCHAPEA